MTIQETILQLKNHHLAAITAHIAASPDREVCGLLGGIWQPYDRLAIAHQVIPTRNVAPCPENQFLMEPREQIGTILSFEQRGLEMIGVYHSHPQGPAVPSPTDIVEALYPDVVYLIGVPHAEITAWRILRGSVYPVQMTILADEKEPS